MRDILFLEPVFKEMIWGGSRLKTEFDYHIPSDSTGECWGISAHPNGDCLISEGEFSGKHLSELWNHNRELFGNAKGEVFPLLIKIIDAKKDLSIQVHPNDEYAFKNEKGSLGKTECWYILDCDEDATIVIGHNAKDNNAVREMIHGKQWSDFIREIPIKKGDFFQINPGCVHAIKAGTLLLETQQNSDITYRVYDYDRLSNGRPRELHVEKSIDVITAPFEEDTASVQIQEFKTYMAAKLIECKYYAVEKYDIFGTAKFNQDKRFLNISIIEGKGFIDGKQIQKGNHFIMPNEYGEFIIEGNVSLIMSYVL